MKNTRIDQVKYVRHTYKKSLNQWYLKMDIYYVYKKIKIFINNI